jgi:hypothetical protein
MMAKEPEQGKGAVIPKQRPANNKHALALVGNSPLSMSRNNKGTVGSGIFYAVHPEAI